MGSSRRGTEVLRKKKPLYFTLGICRASQVTQGEVIWEWQALKRAGWDQIREMYVWLCIKMCKQLDYFCVYAPEAWKCWESVWLPSKLVGILPFLPFLISWSCEHKGRGVKSEILPLVCFMLGLKHSWDYCHILLLPPAFPPQCWAGEALQSPRCVSCLLSATESPAHAVDLQPFELTLFLT